VRALPSSGTGMRGFYDWLSRDPKTPLLAGGADAIAGFNHPGREPGRFGYFAFDQRLVERIVSLEVFNRGEDYLFEGLDDGFASPIAECLDAGWRVGLTGVSDEHGTNWGYPDGKGRTGLWVSELTRAGVREAMMARRFFSTRLRGLRLDAAMNGVRMGQVVGHRSGLVKVDLDLNRGTGWAGRPLVAQLLQTGRPLPTIVHEQGLHEPATTSRSCASSRSTSRTAAGSCCGIVDPEQRRDKLQPAELDGAAGRCLRRAVLPRPGPRRRSAAPVRAGGPGRRHRAGRASACARRGSAARLGARRRDRAAPDRPGPARRRASGRAALRGRRRLPTGRCPDAAAGLRAGERAQRAGR
jgi:hypothetical protein